MAHPLYILYVGMMPRKPKISVVWFQVHGLDAETWKKVDVVYIDIADRTQVEPKVSVLALKLRRLKQCFCLVFDFVVSFRITSQRRILVGTSQ